LFIPQLIRIYEHGEQWWNDIDRGKFLIRPSELPVNPTGSHLVAYQEDLDEGSDGFCLRNISFILVKFFNMAYNFMAWGDGFPSTPKEGVLRIFVALKTGFEPVNLGSNGKNANHYTTEDVNIK
jgi:hypothetical protein